MRLTLSSALALLLAGAIQADDANELARVGIVRFINNTNSEDFEWVEKSLPDAIDMSMKARFEYVRLDEAKVQAAAAQVTPGKPVGSGENSSGARYSKEDAAIIARTAQADILIYGNFVADQANEELVLYATIFNAASNRVIGQVENRTPLNAKIFKNIDQMASEIVSEIYRFALQANQKSTGKKNLKLLVLVPSFTSDEEKAVALQELEVMKQDLAARSPGRYLTIFEFFDAYHVTPAEQEVSLGYARKREKTRLQLWLEGYGVTDAMVVLVSENKVNITAIGASKTAQVSYAVNASPEEKSKQLKAAQEQVQSKVELKKGSDVGGEIFSLYAGPLLSKGMLTSGDKLGLIAGFNMHASLRLFRFFEPHLRLEGYYGMPKDNVTRLLGASVIAGPGYTFTKGKLGFAPYVGAGVFVAQITAAAGQFDVLLPSLGGGMIASLMVSPRWGFALNVHSQYVVDPASPAMFISATLASVVRF